MAISETINDGAFAALNTAINSYLTLDPDTREKLVSFTGKVIAVELQGLNILFYISVSDARLHVEPSCENKIDTTLKGTPLALLTAGIAKNNNAVMGGDLEISGDIETGRQFQRLLQDIDIDWEEHLSHLVGDVVAHQTGNVARSFIQWGHASRENLEQDIGEYLLEEGRYLAHPHEIDSFLSAVNVLRNDTDRLEQRILRIQQKIQGNTDAGMEVQPQKEDA